MQLNTFKNLWNECLVCQAVVQAIGGNFKESDVSARKTLIPANYSKNVFLKLLLLSIPMKPKMKQKNIFFLYKCDLASKLLACSLHMLTTTHINRNSGLCTLLLTLSSTMSKEKSLPSPLELLQLRILDLLVTRALTVHLGKYTEYTLVIMNQHKHNNMTKKDP